ncbi:transglycosylase family protein [Nonomuraea sp. NPDC046570]|uniref:transglycosylase family protein n=1 Tax=Nonomuraea sp. NPDC046570 TaxID=3155255 RepID=UPI0033D8CAAF
MNSRRGRRRRPRPRVTWRSPQAALGYGTAALLIAGLVTALAREPGEPGADHPGGALPVAAPVGTAVAALTERTVSIVAGGRRRIARTTAVTVRDVLREERVPVGRGARVRPPLRSYPGDGVVITVVPADPVPPPRHQPVTAAVAGLNWAGLADCESRGNPAALNPAGPYYGMYQISLPMWVAVGGARTPDVWPAEEQTYRAQLLYQRVQGRWQDQWPHCGARLFT